MLDAIKPYMWIAEAVLVAASAIYMYHWGATNGYKKAHAETLQIQTRCAQEKAVWAAAAASAAQSEQVKTVQRFADKDEVIREAQVRNSKLQGNLAQLGTELDRVHNYASSLAASRGATSDDSAPRVGSAVATDPGDMSTRLSDGLGQAAEELAAEADRRGSAILACNAQYNSLRK